MQAPRVWYENLTRCLKKSKFKKGFVDPNFFRKKDGDHLKIVQIMETKFEISSTGPINIFPWIEYETEQSGDFHK